MTVSIMTYRFLDFALVTKIGLPVFLSVVASRVILQLRETATVGEKVRQAAFWVLDTLSGSGVRKNLADVRYRLENPSDPRVMEKEAADLRALLTYAAEHIDYYKGFDPETPLGSFPVVNKNVIRNNYAAFQSPEFRGGKSVPMQTSGSTGTPFVSRQDKNKRNRVYAEMMYFWGKAGYQIGMRYAFLRVRNPFSRMTAWARNVLVLKIGKQDAEVFEGIRKTLKTDHRIRMILGYPSVMQKLANYLLEQGDSPEMFKIKTIIGFGESFPENAQNRLKAIFDCNIVSLYSNQENGMLAMQCVENKEFHINNASYYIELLKLDSDEPVEGDETGRIVVTDLFNRAMPMIRYDTGDIARWKPVVECDWSTKAFSFVNGQKTDVIFDPMGNEKSPHNISVLMAPFDKLLQYQFVQEDAARYVLKLNGAKMYYDDAQLIRIFQEFLGPGADFRIEHVNEIPVLASGKRKEVLNEYKKVKTVPEIVG